MTTDHGPLTTDQPRHIIWDWNGTLLDDTEACVVALNHCLESRALPPVTCDDYREVFGFPVRDYYLKLGMTFTDPEWNELTLEFHRHYAESSRKAPLRQGIAEALANFREQNIPMSVLSASETSILKRMMAERDISHFFEHVCGLDNLDAHSKLDVGRELMANLAVPRDQILFIGDTTHDFDVASDLGCRCILFAGGHQAKYRLETCDCAVVSGLSELAVQP